MVDIAAGEPSRELTLRELMKGNILVLTVSRIIWSMSSSIVWPYVSLYIIELGGNPPLIGKITALANIAGMLFFPLGGYLADKSGRAKLVGYSTLLFAGSLSIFAMAKSWQWIATAMVIQSLVLFYMPALNAIMADSIPPGARGKILSITISIPEAVRIFSPFIGGWLIERYTLVPAMRIGYTISFITAAGVGLMRIKYLNETIKTKPLDRGIVGIFNESYSNVWTSIRWIIKNMGGYTLIAMILIFSGSLVQPYWMVYAKTITGISEFQWGQVALVGGIAKVIISLYVGNFVDKQGVKKSMIVAFLIAIPAMSTFVYTTGLIDTALVYIILVLANAFIWIASGVLIADSIPRNIRGRIMAGLGQGIPLGVTGGGYAQGFMLFIPSALGSLISGYIYEYNPAYPWYLQSLLLSLCFLLVLKLVKEPENAEV
ncbi:MFS transporter [Candidatus Bathyarchaeota archaeon]|jgi:MFS transporter, DHA1 family, tetracycline resistance protein|nr:MFS transporter [Candidatus Bathyarchaeota archaeon]MBT4319912.1 MFS transporter [Candidatus Bathyarchaeota archaeon]MBT4422834.1 MFS transporter [Candidatus Bathyarchaeota archaeon]MBT6605749.1 MFS transporter [Candidatus Bathyarchaeota archaeon]MBT7186090.1 MFS transporter [Candidatus Bathyarchaeota archaeon]